MTENRDVTAEVTRLPRKLIQVTRADGYKFWVNVTLPQNYRAGTRLPGMFSTHGMNAVTGIAGLS